MTEDVVEDFARFVHSIRDDPEHPIMSDRHFRPQILTVVPDRTPYTRIYDITEIPTLLDDLTAHLRAQGWEGRPLALRPANETPLRLLARTMTPEVTDAVRETFAADFDRFGWENAVPAGLDPADDYPPSALREVARLVERSERVGDLAARAKELREAAKAEKRQLRELRRRAAELDGRSNGALVRKVRRRVSRAIRGG
jgi:hypothetical protein